jgi:hypothetical protein
MNQSPAAATTVLLATGLGFIGMVVAGQVSNALGHDGSNCASSDADLCDPQADNDIARPYNETEA